MSTPIDQLPAGIDPAFGQEPPPKHALPDIDDLGLGVFRQHLSPNGFDTFVSLMHWAVHQQDLAEGKPLKWGAPAFCVAVSPFAGFGNPQMWEAVWLPAKKNHLISILGRWHRKGRKWQKANPLPWQLLEHTLCDFAQPDAGAYNAVMAIEAILADDDFREKWGAPDETV